MIKNLIVLFAVFGFSNEFELGRLYHYSYDSKIELASFGLTAFQPVKIVGHVDVCSLWTDGENELLRVEFHTSHRHSASGVQNDFAISHIRGDDVVDTYLPAGFSNSTISSVLVGFIQHLVPNRYGKWNKNGFLIQNEFDNSFGQHHPVSLNVKQSLSFPLLGSETVEPVSVTTFLHAHLISTSECLHVSVDGNDVAATLEVVSARTRSTFIKQTVAISNQKSSKMNSQSSCKLNDEVAQIDCIASSNSLELHKSVTTGMFSKKPALVRRYFSDMCIRRRSEEHVDLVVSVIKDLLASSTRDGVLLQEINFGIACLLNQICVKGQSQTCQETSALIFERLSAAYKKCIKPACFVALIRAFDAAMTNFPLAEAFLLELVTANEQHPQIAAGALRALGRIGWQWIPSQSTFNSLIEFFEKSQSPEIRYATLDLLLSPTSFLLRSRSYTEWFAQSVERILSQSGPTEFSAYLSTRLRAIISSEYLFREALLSVRGQLIFSLKSFSQSAKISSIYVEGPLFQRIPINFKLDLQNVAQDSLVHSSFSITNRNWKLFEFEIDTVGVATVLGGGGSSKTQKVDFAMDPGASITLKLSGSPDRGVTVMRHADLFRGQNDITSAVWNAPSDLTDIARVNADIFDVTTERVRLINGLTLESSFQVNADVNVQGLASVSIWTQSAETLISTNVKISAKTLLSIPVLSLTRSYEIDGSTEIAFKTNLALGSSGKPDVCLRMSRERVQVATTVKSSRSKTVQSSVLKVVPVNYAFHFYNSQECKNQLQGSSSGDSW